MICSMVRRSPACRPFAVHVPLMRGLRARGRALPRLPDSGRAWLKVDLRCPELVQSAAMWADVYQTFGPKSANLHQMLARRRWLDVSLAMLYFQSIEDSNSAETIDKLRPKVDRVWP